MVAFEELTIDLSSNNKVTDWNKVYAAGVRKVILRASMGKSGWDSRFTQYYDAARSRGIEVSAYHFFRPDSAGIDQAKNFLSATDGRILFMRAIDVESTVDGTSASKDQYAKELSDFVNYFLTETGKHPHIYTSSGEWGKLVGTEHDALFSQCPLWIAAWTDAERPLLPRNWTDYDLWQYTSDGHLDGIDGRVDMNRWRDQQKQNFWMIVPVDEPYRVSQNYGENYDYYMKCCKLPGHEGKDWAKAKGSPVRSVQDGVVKLVASDNGVHPYGNQVRILHDAKDGVFETVYAHLDSFSDIKEGDHVLRGRVLGYVGSTGNSTGYHVHLTLKKNGVIVNPDSYLR